jgi:transcriptional regulator with GAF, ATPase, and Fis domain
MDPEAWIDLTLCEHDEARRAVVGQLASHGLVLQVEAGGSGPGVVVFDREVDAPVIDRVREMSWHGRRRVIAVAQTDALRPEGAGWHLLQAGAADVFAWQRCEAPAARVASRLQRWSEVERLVDDHGVRGRLIGGGREFRGILRQIVEIARFSEGSVLITGESGTGKELIARLIHDLDPRRCKGNFVIVDCTTVVSELSGSEFFGHEKGAFTGAVAARDGAFALANGGTLFLDEVGELRLALQAELLRVVQERTFKRVGGNSWSTTDFRLVCATHRDLLQEQQIGGFRQDLFYRISDWTCRLPPLRDRPEDVLPLLKHFLSAFLRDREPPELDEPVKQYLVRRAYPGNIRELRQIAFRVACRHTGPGPITLGDLGPEEAPSRADSNAWSDGPFVEAIGRALSHGVGLKEIRRIAEETAVRIAVGSEAGNLQSAARLLGVTDRALQLRRASQRPPRLGDDVPCAARASGAK